MSQLPLLSQGNLPSIDSIHGQRTFRALIKQISNKINPRKVGDTHMEIKPFFYAGDQVDFAIDRYHSIAMTPDHHSTYYEYGWKYFYLLDNEIPPYLSTYRYILFTSTQKVRQKFGEKKRTQS